MMKTQGKAADPAAMRRLAREQARHVIADEHAYEQRMAKQRAISEGKRRPHTRQSR